MKNRTNTVDIDNLPIPFFEIGTNERSGTYIAVALNQKAKEIFGSVTKAKPARELDSLLADLDGGSISSFLDQIISTPAAGPVRRDVVLPTPDGPVFATAEFHFGNAGDNPSAYLVNLQSGTGFVTNDLKETSTLQDILAALPEFLFFADTDQKIRMFTEVVHDWLGESNGPIIGTNLGQWADRVHNPEMAQWARDALKSRKTFSGNSIWQFDNGQIRHVDVTIVPAQSDQGQILGVYIIARDQTEQIVAKQQSRAAEQRFRSILRLSPEAVITTGPEGDIRLFSRGAEEIFGYAAAEIIGKSLDLLIPERFRKIHKSHMARFRGQEIDHLVMTQRSEITGLRRNGQEFPASASVSKLDMEKTQLFTVLLHDITDQKIFEDQLSLAKEEAERANVAKSDFLASMSHELRTPLNAIIGFSEMITGEIVGPVRNPKYIDYAANIHTAGRHLLSLIDDLLDISRLEMGDIDLHDDVIDLPDMIEEVNTMIRGIADQAQLEYACVVQPELPQFRGDRRRLSQILLNILSNAIKFTPPGNSVTFSTFVHGNDVTFTISDNGIGIRDEDISRITDPFVQTHELDINRAPEANGVGLGLALVKKMTELHDGELRIESSYNIGTTVSVRFPASRSIWSPTMPSPHKTSGQDML